MTPDADARRRRRPGRGEDRGATLVELLVAMVVFTVVLTLVGSAVASMTRSTVRVSGTGQAIVEVTRMASRFDKQVPYAAAVNEPARVGADWYVEYRTDVPAGGLPAGCWQYRLNAGQRALEARTWPVGSPGSVTPWRRVASQVEARAGGPDPFRFLPATADVGRQRLAVALDVVPRGAPRAPLDGAWVARNTSPATVTNTVPVGQTTRPRTCTEVTRS